MADQQSTTAGNAAAAVQRSPNTIAARLPKMLHRHAASPFSHPPLPPPAYLPPQDAADRSRIFLALESFRQHMTDEGHQLQSGLEQAGYQLFGHGYTSPRGMTDTGPILAFANPSVCIVQDKREWDSSQRCCYVPQAYFHRTEMLADRPDIFRLTICKDAHQRPDYHRQAHAEIGTHAWITYYHPQIVCSLAPWIRQQHTIRTWHTIDRDQVPEFSMARRRGAILSGAASKWAYPLRHRLLKAAERLPHTRVLTHPGYGIEKGSQTNGYLHKLSRAKVSICTSSIFAFALRKIIESTACGCIVLTDLPTCDRIPAIDGNLVRIHPDATVEEVGESVMAAIGSYDPARQQAFAEKAKLWFDYRVMGQRLAEDIEQMRAGYQHTIGGSAASCGKEGN